MAEFESTDIQKYITKKDFPDFGIKVPKSKEERQQCEIAVETCLSELERPDNFDAFQQATIKMFAAFGVPYSDVPEEQAWTTESLKMNYDRWQEDKNSAESNNRRFADVEMRTPKGGYVNVYLQRMRVKGRPSLTIIPGACSFGDNRPPTSEYLPVQNFYEAFYRTIDPNPRFGENRIFWEKALRKK